MFRTDDGFLFEDGKNFTLINHKAGGYRLDKLTDTKEFFFSNFEAGSPSEVVLFNRIREILRLVSSFKEELNG
jgi:hypothetical protein